MATCPIDADFIADQVAAVKAAIAAYNSAILAIATGAQSYSLDTGQSRQTVTRADLATMRIQRNELMNELEMLNARTCGGTTRVIPGF